MGTTTADVMTTIRSLDEFYAATYARLVAVLTVTAGSRVEAEEVVQEAFVRLVPRWDKVSQYDDPEQWVRTVAWRLATSRWRKVVTGARALRRHGPPPDVPAPSTSPWEVEEVLAGLSLEHRQVLVLHYGLGLSIEECATQLGVAPGTVKSRLSRARAVAREENPDV
jgi:RNA polymerase sigma-70 factor (ECF subfamily)